MFVFLSGDRRVWVAGGVVLVLACVGILTALAEPRERLTGSNSVGLRVLGQLAPGELPHGDVVTVEPGERLCVAGLAVPAGTGGIRFVAFWTRGRPAFVVSMQTSEGRRGGAVAPSESGDDVDLHFAELRSDAASVRGRVCIESRRASAGIGGTSGRAPDRPAPSLSGKPLDAQIALWYLAPEGSDSSLLARLPDIARRAALFRPGIVANWWYGVALLIVPLLWFCGLRLLARSAGGGVHGRRAAATIAALACANASLWAILTPAFQAPDEPAHFSFTQSLVENGKVPDKAPTNTPPISSRAALALDSVRAFALVCPPHLLDRPCLSVVRPPWLSEDEQRWKRRLAAVSTRRDDGGGFSFEVSPHGPGYYALTAPAYLAAHGQSTFSQLTLMRLVSALLAAVTAACAFLTVLELVPRQQWVAAVAGLLVAFQPQFSFISGTVNNDNGVNAAAALLIFLLIRGLRRGPTARLGAAIGAALVAVHVTKGTGAALYPAALVGITGMTWRYGLRAHISAYGALVAVAGGLQGVWGLMASSIGSRPFTTPGGSAGPGLAGVVERAIEHPQAFASYVWQFFLPRLPFMTDFFAYAWPAYDVYLVGGWAAFGWLSVRFPDWVYVVILIVSVIVAVACTAVVVGNRVAAAARNWELAVLLVALASVLVGVNAGIFEPNFRWAPGEQGRYIFTAMVPLAAIAAGATMALGRVRGPAVGAVLAAAVMGLGGASQMLMMTWLFG